MYRQAPLIASVIFALVGPAAAQQSQPAYPFDAEIAANDVYVRSGPGSNYYPTTKLHAGDKVRALGEQFGWIKIAPPTGSFSYVDMTMVDKTGPTTGKVKVENLRVYAGSSLSTKKRELQAMLAKDAAVTIAGDADGFYKIEPPSGAVLWVSGQFVRRPGDKTPLVKPAVQDTGHVPIRPKPAAGATDGGTTGLPTVPGGTMGTRTGSTPATTPPAGPTVKVGEREPDRWTPFVSSGSTGAQLTAAEAELRTVLKKQEFTIAQLETLRSRFEAIASQEGDAVATAVAKTRIKQLTDRIEILAARQRIAEERKDLDAYRTQLGEDRDRIKARAAANADSATVMFKGLLRVSLLFPTSMGRFRLADPADPQTTVAYIDVPEELRSKAKQYLDEPVTVKVRTQAFNDNLRVPVAVVSDIIGTPKPVAATPSTQAVATPKEAVAGQPAEEDDAPPQKKPEKKP